MTTYKTNQKENRNYTIYYWLKQGLSPKKICQKLNISYRVISYHLNSLKLNGYINKIGYGTWQVTEKELTNETRYGNSPKEVRGHAFRFQLQIKRYKEWEQAKNFFLNQLTKKKINYSILKNGVVSFNFKNKKVWLCPNFTVHFFFRRGESIFTRTAKESYILAYDRILSVIKSLESNLKADFSFSNGLYRLKVLKQHYALVNNEVAKDYRTKGINFIEFRNKKGELWGLIDNSYNLSELETVHPKTAIKDNDKLKNLINSIPVAPFTGFDIQDIKKELQEQLETASLNVQMTKSLQEQIVTITSILEHLKNQQITIIARLEKKE